MAWQVAVVKTKMLANKQNGFSLIELLVVLLIAGILLGAAAYSIRLLNQQQQTDLTIQLKNQIQATQHKSALFNWLMRIRLLTEKQQQRIVAERFDFDKYSWQIDGSIDAIQLADDALVNMERQFLLVMPNGFTTNSNVCIDDACIRSVEE